MIDLAEYALYRCIEEEDNKITYSFEILDDCKVSDDAITNCVRKNIKRFSSRPANSTTANTDIELRERATSFINRSYIRESSDSAVFVEDNNEDAEDHDIDDGWLQPKYDKENDVLQLMVSVKSKISHASRVTYFVR